MAFVASELAVGSQAGLASRDVVLAELNFLLLAYAVAARLHFARATRATLAALRPALVDAPEVDALVARTGSLRAPALWATLGAVVASMSPLVVDPGQPFYDPRTWSPEVAWHRIAAPFTGAAMWVLLAGVVAESRRFDRLAAWLRPLDPLDPRPLEPFVRQGLTQALLLAGSVAVALLLLVEDRMGPVVASIGALGAVGAGLGLVLPLRAARARLRAAVDAALARCRAALAAAASALADRDPVASGALSRDPVATSAPGRLADLAALEARLERSREWPFDASTLLRVALYLLLPVGSWAGGALVERAIDAFLDR